MTINQRATHDFSALLAGLFAALLMALLSFSQTFITSAHASNPGVDEYFLELMETKNVTCEDGITLVLYLINASEYRRPFNEKILALKRERIIPESFKLDRDWPLRRGFMAYMLMNALKIRTNFMIRSGGMSGRYAHKELAALKIMTGGSDKKRMGGGELVSVYLRAHEFQKKGKVEHV